MTLTNESAGRPVSGGVGHNSRRARSVGELDATIGEKLRGHRRAAGLSQQKLAACVGISFQQLQKYEKGVNRLTLSRFIDICAALSLKAGDVVTDMTAAHPTQAASTHPRAMWRSRVRARMAQTLSAAERRRVQAALIELVEALEDDAPA